MAIETNLIRLICQVILPSNKNIRYQMVTEPFPFVGNLSVEDRINKFDVQCKDIIRSAKEVPEITFNKDFLLRVGDSSQIQMAINPVSKEVEEAIQQCNKENYGR